MRTRIYFVTMLVLGLALSGCYQSAGSQLDPTPKNVNVTTAAFPATFTPEGTEIGQVPTEETITQIPVVTEEGVPVTPSPTIFTPFPTYTPTNLATFPPTANVNSGQGGPLPTYTSQQAVMAATFTPYVPPPTLTNTPTSTFAPPATFTPQPTNTPALPTNTPTVGFTPTITPLVYQPLRPSPTFTLFAPPQAVQQQPQEAIPQPEQTQIAVVPSNTPETIAQVATISPPQATATALVFQATANAAATLGTQLAPPGVPTFTPGGVVQPTIGPTLGPGVTPTAMGQCNSYLISPGDTLSRIALNYGVTVQQVAQMNNIVNPDLIRAGDTLLIPCPIPATPTPQPTVGTGQGGAAFTPVPGGGPSTYMVEPGDTLYRISIRFGVSLYDLMVANGLTPSTINMIYAGQTLYIPASTVPAATPLPTQGVSAG